MNSYYLINIIPYYKPWRGKREVYTTNKEVFDLISRYEDINDVTDLESNIDEETGGYVEEFCIEEWLSKQGEDPSYPIVLLGLTDIYTE